MVGVFLLQWAVCLIFIQSTQAGFNANIQSNVAIYWGQNSAGQATSQQRLSTYCSNTKLNIIPLAFMYGITTPRTDFANAGNNCTVYSGTNLWNCPQIEEDIKTCQKTYSKTIVLSLGGATYTEGGFASASAATDAGTNVWNLFGPNTGFANRPFRTAVVDGFDFDFEASTQNTATFAQRLRTLMNAATAAGDKQYYLTAAPQCPFPDVALNDILTNVAMDVVMVQFYNNYCGVSSFTQGTASQNNFNMDTWDTWAKTKSKNPNVKVLMGVPANNGAGGGYISADALAPVIAYSRKFSSFGGVMMWDMSQMATNPGFLDGVFSALTAASGSTSSSTSSRTTSSFGSSVVTSSRSTGTTSAGGPSTSASLSTGTPTSPASSRTTSVSTSSLAQLPTTAGTCVCPAASTVTVTATVFTTGTVAQQSTPKPTVSTSSLPGTRQSSTTQTTSAVSSTQSIANQQLVNQWGQCGGNGYTGSTQCKPPYTCVYDSEWWSDCR